MSTKKTIQINPELFKISGNKTKTRKHIENNKLILNPIVTPNNLKNKLLKRIKEHKTQEINKGIKPKNVVSSSEKETSYSDEFYGALDYLSDLTKKQKNQKFTNEARQRAINTRTLKNYQSQPLISNDSNISLELPPELEEHVKSSLFVPKTEEVLNINYKVLDDVPYGCLKGGNKKTYREWKELSKQDTIDVPDIVRPPTPPKKNIGIFLDGATIIEPPKNSEIQYKLSREQRLEQIKNKLRQLQDQETTKKQDTLENFKNLENKFSTPIGITPLEDLQDFDKTASSNIDEMIIEHEERKENEKTCKPEKKYLKKTIKRKFTLGKSDKLRRVGVLITDRQTRKNIIDTQKELKKTNITDVRKYLRQHGIIKVGSTCPADILRKTFESAVLTGEVTNTNKETLLHNFLSGDK